MPEHPMIDCPGSAHQNAFVDHCNTCLRWGWAKVPAFLGMGEVARWTLRLLADIGQMDCPGMPEDVMKACQGELTKYGYVALAHRVKKSKGSETHFLVYEITSLGKLSTLTLEP